MLGELFPLHQNNQLPFVQPRAVATLSRLVGHDIDEVWSKKEPISRVGGPKCCFQNVEVMSPPAVGSAPALLF